MSEIPDYGEDAVTPENTSEDKLANLRKLVHEWTKTKLHALQLEEQLEAAKSQCDIFEKKLVPDLMLEIGLDELKTVGGMKVRLEENLVGTFPKSEEKRERAFRYLEETGNDGLIKQQISVNFPRDSSEMQKLLEQALDDLGIAEVAEVRKEKTINHNSMMAFLRRQLEVDEKVPLDAFGAIKLRTAKMDLGVKSKK